MATERLLRVATFNVQHGRRTAGPVDLALTARTCAELDVDVLGLQEVDVWVPRSRWRNQAAAVAAAGATAFAFGPASRLGRIGRYGNALFARGGLGDVEVLALPKRAGTEARAALLGLVEVAGTRASVAVTHLSVDAAETDAQLDAVLAAVSARPLPRIVLGDLNRLPADVVDRFGRAGFTLAGGGPTFPATGPRSRIDHVAVAGFEVSSVEIPVTPCSDHRPLVVALRRPRR